MVGNGGPSIEHIKILLGDGPDGFRYELLDGLKAEERGCRCRGYESLVANMIIFLNSKASDDDSREYAIWADPKLYHKSRPLSGRMTRERRETLAALVDLRNKFRDSDRKVFHLRSKLEIAGISTDIPND